MQLSSLQVMVICDRKANCEILGYISLLPCYYIYIYIYIYYKYSTHPHGISINIAPKVGIFPEAEGRGKYSLPRVQYYRYSTRKG